MLSRRHFLVTGSLSVAAGAIAPRVLAAQPQDEWDAVRSEFDLDPSFVHLSLFYMTAHPRPVRAAIEEWRRKLDSNPLLTVEHAMFDFEHRDQTAPVRTAVAIAAYIGAKPDEVALTQNTTAGLSLIYHGLPLKAGDEVLTTAHDHYVHHEAIRLATERAGATWRRIALFDSHEAISADEMVSRIARAIRPKTRVVGVTWVHSSTGLKLPIRRNADAIAEVNAKRDARSRVLLVVDGVHGLGVEAPEIAKMGADAFAAGTHKWIFGPRGTGFVWARPEVWTTMRPLFASFTAFEPIDGWMNGKPPAGTPTASWFTPGGFWAFEHYWALPAAFEFHHRIGPARVTERIHSLNEMAKNELAAMPHVTLYTPRSRDLSSGIICFDVKGTPHDRVVRTLLERDKILASTTPYKVSYARIAFGLYNNESDVEKTLRAIRALAS